MTSSSRPFLLLFGSLVLAMICAGVVLAISVHRGGMVAIDIHATGPDGCDIHGLRVPGLFVDGVIRLLPNGLLHQGGAEARTTSAIIRRACQALQRIPDCALVEVEGTGERVRIIKRGDSLLVDVQSESEEVHLAVPLRTLDVIARKMASS